MECQEEADGRPPIPVPLTVGASEARDWPNETIR